MKNGTVIEQDIQVQIPLTITKVDKATREVEGIASQEVVDIHGEIVDHDSMKAVLEGWPGNIREMHQPIAVGKAIKVVSDDDAKATIVRARISKGAPDTWEKVLDTTLSMFSIGGSGKRITKKSADGKEEKRIIMSALHEISLVDNGACPTAKFELVKSVDGISTEVQPVEPAPDAVATEGRGALLALLAKAVTGEITRTPKTQLAAKAAVTKLQTVPEAAVIKGGYPECYDINLALQAISCLESLLAGEWYEAREEAINGEDDDAQTAQSQLALLRQAVNLVMAFLLSEFDEQFSEFDEADAGDDTGTPIDLDNRADTRGARIADVVTKFLADAVVQKMLPAVEKKGARHSKNDQSMIQGMHDSAVSLGAACSTDKAVTTQAVQPIAATTELVELKAGAALVTEDSVTKLIADAVAQALAGQEATHKTAIAALEERVEKLAKSPRPGGPVTQAIPATAVQKTVGGGGSGNPFEGVDPSLIAVFAAELAKDAKSEEERTRIATNLIKFQHASGAGGVAITARTGRPFAASEPQE